MTTGAAMAATGTDLLELALEFEPLAGNREVEGMDVGAEVITGVAEDVEFCWSCGS